MNVPEGWAENAMMEQWGDCRRGREPQKSQMGEDKCGGERGGQDSHNEGIGGRRWKRAAKVTDG